jgi:hypothetical protein
MDIIEDKKIKNRPLFPSGYKINKKKKIKCNAIKHDEKIQTIKFTYGKFIVKF